MPEPIEIPFGKHFPDRPALNNPGTPFLRNVIPANGFVRPFAALNTYSDALAARAQGAISSRDTAGDVFTFAGDAGALYKLIAGVWSDVTRASGGAYSTPSTGRWEFILWSNDILIAINGADAPQKIDPQTGTNFEALGGSPPPAKHGAVVRSFIFLGNWTDNENVVQWSAIDDAEEYNTDGTNQSDQEAIPSGEPIKRILGGEVGIVFCQSSIHRFGYVGSPVIFQRDEIGPGVGLIAPGAVAQFGNLIFFVGQNSFYRLDIAAGPVPLGESRWNKTFFADLDQNNLDKVVSAIDPINTIWLVAYPNSGSADGVPNRMFLYNWAADDAAFVDIDAEYVFGAYSPGISLDELTDTTGFSLDDLPFSLDSRIWQGGALSLAGFDREHRLGYFSGASLEAEIETAERALGTRRLYISGARPLVDAADAVIAIGARENQFSMAAFGAFTAIGPDGQCPQHVEARFARARLLLPAGSSWSKAQGVEIYAGPAGEL